MIASSISGYFYRSETFSDKIQMQYKYIWGMWSITVAPHFRWGIDTGYTGTEGGRVHQTKMFIKQKSYEALQASATISVSQR